MDDQFNTVKSKNVPKPPSKAIFKRFNVPSEILKTLTSTEIPELLELDLRIQRTEHFRKIPDCRDIFKNPPEIDPSPVQTTRL